MTEKVEQCGTPRRNTKKRAWCFTWNNYTDEDITYLQEKFKEGEYLFGEEIGEKGTKHLQGVVRYTNPRSFKSIRKTLKNNHIEACKNWPASLNYCSKEGKTYSNIEKINGTLEQLLLREEYKDVIWRDWQQQVINILEENPDRRKIHWYHDEEGNKGKSFLCKYIALKYNAIICSGKTNDIFNQTLNWRLENKTTLQIPPCIIDIPRSEFSHTNYAAIEQLKNGFLYSGKYEGGKVFGLPPHVFIFANCEPKQDQMSEDRWVIYDIGSHPPAPLP